MPYYITLSGGTTFEFRDGMENPNFKYEPNAIRDKSPYYPSLYPYVKPYGGVTSPPPVVVERQFATWDLPRTSDNWHLVYSRSWGINTEFVVEYLLYYYQGERWGFPSDSCRMRIIQNGVTLYSFTLTGTSGGSDGYGSYLLGFEPFEAFSVGGAVYYSASIRKNRNGGYSTSVECLERNYETYNLVQEGGWTGYYSGDSANHVIFSKAWLDSLGEGIDPLFTPNGYYKGLPTSAVPLKQFIRGNINYMRNIDIYDETNQKKNNAFLVNRVGSISYNGVNFSYPRITFRAKTELQFTHVVTASWSDDNRPVVYRVVNYYNVGNDVNEYTVEIDGLKTYFQHNGITTNNPICMRSTESRLWNKWVQDTVPYDGTYEYHKTTGTTLSYVIVVVVNGTDIMAFSQGSFTAFCRALLNRNDQEKIISQISACYMCPVNFSGDNQTLFETAESPYYFVGTEYSITPTYYGRGKFGTTTMTIPSPTGLYAITDQSYVYDSHATIHCPGYGDVNAPIDFIVRLATVSNDIRYRISLVDGTISVSTYPFTMWSPSIALANISIPFNSEKVQLYNVNRNQQAGVSNLLTSATSTAIIGAVGGFMMGGGAGAKVGAKVGARIGGAIGGAIVGGATSYMANSQNVSAQRDIIANSQGLNGASCTGASSFADMQVYIAFNVPNLSINYPDYYSVVGYPVMKPLIEVGATSGSTIWLAWNSSVLDDKEEVIDDLVTQSANGIVWNA